MQNKAIRELFEKHEVLEVAFVAMAHEVIRTAPWGLMWRVGLGAVLSVIDVATDLNVTLSFRNGGEAQAIYYHAMFVSLGLSWGLQLWLTIAQNKGRGGSALAKELFWTVLFLKSPRDAFKVRVAERWWNCGGWCRRIDQKLLILSPFPNLQVANGVKQEKGALVDPLLELTGSKCVELFTEGLPAVAIQVAAAVFKGSISQMELLSLIISIVMSGFTSAQISYDFDTE